MGLGEEGWKKACTKHKCWHALVEPSGLLCAVNN